MPSFYEFFAGGCMVRAGLGEDWTCLFANDFDARKGLAYQTNWGVGGELTVGDIRGLDAGDLPGRPDLVWGSFPCQDLSLAGAGAGLAGERGLGEDALYVVELRLAGGALVFLGHTRDQMEAASAAARVSGAVGRPVELAYG